MTDQGRRQIVHSKELIEHLRQIVEVPRSVTGATIVLETGDAARIEWRTIATPAKDAGQ